MGPPGRTLAKADPLDMLRSLAGKKMQDACEHLRDVSRARGGLEGGLVGREDVEASLARIDLAPPTKLMDDVWSCLGAPGEKVSIWTVLSKLPAPRAGRSVERMLERIANVRESIKATVEQKRFRQTAELGSTEQRFWQELNTLRLGADGDDSAFKIKERELMKLVSNATTSSMKKNSEAALSNFRDLMKVGHTPVPTPRGSRFMVVDYERPRTHENNMLIDLLAPDSHQNWRGTLRHNHVKLWKEKHDAMEHRYNAVMNKSMYQRERAQALAFSKDPFPAQHIIEARRSDEEETKIATHRSAPELWRPSTRSSLAGSDASRPMSRLGTAVNDDVSSGVFYLLDHLRQMSFSLNDAFAAVKTSDGFIDREKFEHFWGIMPDDKKGGTSKWQQFEALWNYLNKNRNPLILDMYGKVSVQDAKEAISRVLEHVGWVTGSSSWDMDCRSWRHPDPSVGKINVSASLFSLLYTVRQRLALRWRKGVSDAFQMLEVPGQLVSRSEVRALLSAIAIHPTSARFEAFWCFLDQHNRGKIRWVDFKECFELSDDISERLLHSVEEGEEEAKKLAPVARRGTRKKKKGRNGVRSESAPPGSLSDMSDEDDAKDLLRSLYDVTFSAAIKQPTFDKFSKWSPLGKRGYRTRPKTTMRPMSVLSDRDFSSHSPDKRERGTNARVHFRTRDMACQVDSDADSPLPPLQHRPRESPTITLTPFSNLRNGSNIKMSWRRWTGGETRGVAKSSNDDPAAPGATASLLLGAGEFQAPFQRSLQIAKSLEKILQNHPDLVFDMQQRGFKTTSPGKKLEAPSSTEAAELESFVQTLFPTGLGAQK